MAISGLYTPTLNPGPNATTCVLLGSGMYIAIGSIVTVAFKLQLAFALSANTQIEVSIPIPSIFASNQDGTGTIQSGRDVSGAGDIGLIRASTTTVGVIVVEIFPIVLTARSYSAIATYQVLP